MLGFQLVWPWGLLVETVNRDVSLHNIAPPTSYLVRDPPFGGKPPWCSIPVVWHCSFKRFQLCMAGRHGCVTWLCISGSAPGQRPKLGGYVLMRRDFRKVPGLHSGHFHEPKGLSSTFQLCGSAEMVFSSTVCEKVESCNVLPPPERMSTY